MALQLHAFLTSKEAHRMTKVADFSCVSPTKPEKFSSINMRLIKGVEQLNSDDQSKLKEFELNKINKSYKKSMCNKEEPEIQGNIQQSLRSSLKHFQFAKNFMLDLSQKTLNISLKNEENLQKSLTPINNLNQQPNQLVNSPQYKQLLQEKEEYLKTFHMITNETKNICKAIIPDIKLMQKTQKIIQQGVKTKTVENDKPWTKSSQYLRKRKEIFEKIGIKKDTTLNPFFKFLGYTSSSDLPKSPRGKMEQIETRFLWHKLQQRQKEKQQLLEQGQLENKKFKRKFIIRNEDQEQQQISQEQDINETDNKAKSLLPMLHSKSDHNNNNSPKNNLQSSKNNNKKKYNKNQQVKQKTQQKVLITNSDQMSQLKTEEKLLKQMSDNSELNQENKSIFNFNNEKMKTSMSLQFKNQSQKTRQIGQLDSRILSQGNLNESNSVSSNTQIFNQLHLTPQANNKLNETPFKSEFNFKSESTDRQQQQQQQQQQNQRLSICVNANCNYNDEIEDFIRYQNLQNRVTLLKAKKQPLPEDDYQIKDIQNKIKEVMARYCRDHSNDALKLIKKMKKHRIWQSKPENQTISNIDKELISKQQQYKLFRKEIDENQKKFRREQLMNSTTERIYSKKRFDMQKLFSIQEDWANIVKDCSEMHQIWRDQVKDVKTQINSCINTQYIENDNLKKFLETNQKLLGLKKMNKI